MRKATKITRTRKPAHVAAPVAEPIAPASEMSGSRDPRPTTREETGRRKRIPLGAPQAKLAAEQRAGYVRRWINDANGRVQNAIAAGYEHVEDAGSFGRGEKVKRQVGTHPDGSPMQAYLMEIRQEFYVEDQALKARELDKLDAAMRRPTPQGATAPEDRNGFYGEGLTNV